MFQLWFNLSSMSVNKWVGGLSNLLMLRSWLYVYVRIHDENIQMATKVVVGGIRYLLVESNIIAVVVNYAL